MLVELEEVLKEKERELKLYRKFAELRSLCEKSIFPDIEPPIQKHVDILKQLIEQIIPEPKDRTEEMFSGEIFALLGTIYLHDIGFAKNGGWYDNSEIFNALDPLHKRILVNLGIAKQLDIPETAMEIINYLTFSDAIKKMPLEWEITDDSKKAIIRNTKVIDNIFNFAHLLVDVFYTGIGETALRRFSHPIFTFKPDRLNMDINSRSGVISIKYGALTPYEFHVAEKAKEYVHNAFNAFKTNVNGRLGFQYRELAWCVTRNFDCCINVPEIPKLSSCRKSEGALSLNRWEETFEVLDKVFDDGCALVVGKESTGKTTVLTSFIMPQIVSMTPQSFYCELWASPVNEIRDVICNKYKAFSYSDLDIVSICTNLLKEGPCFFIIDACERTIDLDGKEREKFERFVDFCFNRENIYLIACGDSDDFFEWYTPFHGVSLSALTMITPIQGATIRAKFGKDRFPGDPARSYTPLECAMMLGDIDLEGAVRRILDKAEDGRELRSIMAVLIDRNEKHLKRYTADTITFETSITPDIVQRYLDAMKEEGLVKETRFLGSSYYSLANRFLKNPLFSLLELAEYEEKRTIRSTIQNAWNNDTFLDAEALDIVEKWQENMVFSKEGMGIILSSLIEEGKDFQPFFEKARHSDRGIDIQPILKLIYSEDAKKRGDAIRLLGDIQDKNMVNPLLLHLKKETVDEIKDLLIKGIGLTGKRKAVVAILDTLKEIGDSRFRLMAIEFFSSLFGENSKTVLNEIKEKEEDPVILEKIEKLLSTPET